MNNKTAQDVIYLVSCAVNEKTPDKERMKSMNFDDVYAFASRHMIASAAGMALENAGCKEERFCQAVAAAQRRALIFKTAMAGVKNGLEKAGIWYMPLKGSVLKDLYPKFGMREFVDHDILFDKSRASDVKAVMEGLDFTTEHFGKSGHDVYYKRPLINFEMHRELFGKSHDETFYEYYRHVEDRLLGGGFEKHFSQEDFYLYFLAHDYKHFAGGGTGIRSLLDTYVFLMSADLDMDYVAIEAEKLGIRTFEEKNRSLSFHLFGDGELSDSEEKMLDYILSSGSFGTIQHRVSNTLHKNKWTKPRYMLNRFLVPVSRKNKSYDAYAAAYPFFYQHKVFLPALPFFRTFRSMKEGRFGAEAKAILKAEDEMQ